MVLPGAGRALREGMHLTYLGGREHPDQLPLDRIVSQVLPAACLERSGFLGGSLHASQGALHLELGKSNNAHHGPRVPWTEITIALPTQGLEVDVVTELRRRSFQRPIRVAGEHLVCGGPRTRIERIFEPALLEAITVLGRRLSALEIRDDRLLLRVNGWPADAQSLWFALDLAQRLAARVQDACPDLSDAELVAYRAGRAQSARVGKLLLLGVLGATIPSALAMVALMTAYMR
ncbi:MAG: hypothetical protein K1X94_32465 [Sandaracinaceae bacterium]|nr:hypothetical protein [Sandaracinaceae bacterium]